MFNFIIDLIPYLLLGCFFVLVLIQAWELDNYKTENDRSIEKNILYENIIEEVFYHDEIDCVFELKKDIDLDLILELLKKTKVI